MNPAPPIIKTLSICLKSLGLVNPMTNRAMHPFSKCELRLAESKFNAINPHSGFGGEEKHVLTPWVAKAGTIKFNSMEVKRHLNGHGNRTGKIRVTLLGVENCAVALVQGRNFIALPGKERPCPD